MKKAEKVQDGSGNFLESPFKHVFYHLRLRLHKIRRKKLWVKRRVLGFISEVAGGLGRVKYQNGRRGIGVEAYPLLHPMVRVVLKRSILY